MNALLPLAALAAAVLLLGGKKASASTPSAPAAAPRGIVTPGTPTVIKRPAAAKPAAAPKSDAVKAAELADQQLGKPASSAQVKVQSKVAQTIPGPALPPGYNRAEATRRAQPMADQIRTKKGKYDRAALQTFQTFAGMTADGLYGPQTRAALIHFGAKNAPAALFKGANVPYTAPKGG